MSLLDRLSALVTKIKSDEIDEPTIKKRMEQMFSETETRKEEEDVSEEREEPQEEVQEEVQEEAQPEAADPPERVDFPGEALAPVTELRLRINRLHLVLGQMAEDFEKRKASALAALQASQTELESTVISLRDSHGIPSDVHYTIVFPQEEGGTGAFVRVDPS